MWLNPHDRGISHRLISRGFREPAFMWILRKEAFGFGMDIGANLGYCTLSMAKKCDKVYAFEPDERSRKLLEKNIKLNKLENVYVFKEAIGSKICTVVFEEHEKPNLSRVIEEKDEYWTEGIKCLSIDEICETTGQVPNFIKMDIEGGEVKALEGALKTLEKAKHLKILIEVHPQFYVEDTDSDMRIMLSELTKIMGYYIKYVVNAKGKIDLFKDYTCVKRFSHYKHRAVFKDVPEDKAIKWACEMPSDGLKVIRAILLERSNYD